MLGKLLLLLLMTVAACVPRAEPEPLPLPAARSQAQVLFEEDAPAPVRPDLAILDFKESVSDDGTTAVVSGTIVNRGDGATRQLQVTVSGINTAGETVLRLPASPETDRIAPNGSTRFGVTFERVRAIDQYRVEVIGR